MKTYTVVRSSSGEIGVLIKSNESKNAKILQHVAMHSPTGMETGYGGSGPADLAVSILADFFGVTPERIKRVWRKSWGLTADNAATDAIKLHQLFKRDFIARKKLDPGESYVITSEEIKAWIARKPEA